MNSDGAGAGPSRALVIGVAWATVAQALDGRMLGVTLPLLRGHLGATIDEANWVVIAYLMASFAILPLSPWLSAHLGRRRYYLISIAGFALTGVLCALATSLGVLVFWRALQGAFGAGLIAVSQAILREGLPDRALGLSQVVFAGTFVGAPLALGPLLGGIILDSDASWRWTFVIVAVLASAAALVCLKGLPEQERAHECPLDGAGAALLAAALVPLPYVFYEGQRYNWLSEPRIVVLTLISLAAAAAFAVWELRARRPLFDRRLLAVPSIAIGVVLIVPLALVLSAVVSIVLQFAEQLLSFTATLAGELTVVRALVFIPLIVLMGVVIDRRPLPVRLFLLVGLLLLALASWMQMFATTATASFSTLIVAFAVGGVAIAPAVVPLLWAVLRAVPRERTLEVTTLLALGLQLGGAATPALVQSELARRFAYHYEVLRSSSTVSHLALVHLPAHVSAVRLLVKLVTEQSYALAFGDVALAVAAIAVLSTLLVPLLRSRCAGPGA